MTPISGYYVERCLGDATRLEAQGFRSIEDAEAFQDYCYAKNDGADYYIEGLPFKEGS
jgi:hypothetical protein